jgi:hypothetical protein
VLFPRASESAFQRAIPLSTSTRFFAEAAAVGAHVASCRRILLFEVHVATALLALHKDTLLAPFANKMQWSAQPLCRQFTVLAEDDDEFVGFRSRDLAPAGRDVSESISDTALSSDEMTLRAGIRLDA